MTTNTKGSQDRTASIDLAQLDKLQRYADSCAPTALSSETLGALVALARRSLTNPSISSSVESLSRASGEERFLTSGAPAELSPDAERLLQIAANLEDAHISAVLAGEDVDEETRNNDLNFIRDTIVTAKFALRECAAVHDTATPSAAQASVDWIYSVLRDVGELDYDSPEDQPDLMMVTTDELFTIIRRHAPSAGAAAKTEQAPFRERFADAYKSLSVAHFNGPFWNQGMEELLVAVDAEINKRVAERTAAGAVSDQADGPDNWALPGIPTGCHIQVDVAANLCEKHDFLTCASTLRAISDAMKAGRQKSASPSVPVQDERALFEAAEEAKGHFANILERGPTSPTRRDALAGIAALDHAIQARAALSTSGAQAVVDAKDGQAAAPHAQAEPVAWCLLEIMDPEVTNDPEMADYWKRKGRKVTPLYAAPVPQEAEQAAPAAVTEAIFELNAAIHKVLIAGSDHGDELSDLGLRDTLKQAQHVAYRALIGIGIERLPGAVNPLSAFLPKESAAGQPAAPAVTDERSIGMRAAADFIDKRAAAYADENASTEWDTGSTVWNYGEAGRDYYNTLVELAEDLRHAAAPAVTDAARDVLADAKGGA